jgi:hypothetical protein
VSRGERFVLEWRTTGAYNRSRQAVAFARYELLKNSRKPQHEGSPAKWTIMTHRTNKYTRRAFIGDGAVFGAGLMAINAFGRSELNRGETPTSGAMPKIKLGGFEVSRLILGSNPFWGFWHKNPRKPQDYTHEGRKAVMDAAAAQGITAVWCPGYREWIALWND